MKKYTLIALLALGFTMGLVQAQEQAEEPESETIEVQEDENPSYPPVPVIIKSGELGAELNVPVEARPSKFKVTVQVMNDTLELDYKVDAQGNIKLDEQSSAMTRVQKRVTVKAEALAKEQIEKASKAIETKVLKLFDKLQKKLKSGESVSDEKQDNDEDNDDDDNEDDD